MKYYINKILILTIFLTILFLAKISISIKSYSNEYHCDPLNKTTYLIPSADNCTIGFREDGDSYYFGPCFDLECFIYEKKCMYALGRRRYCKGGDAHFCAFIDSGNFNNYFIVECG